MTRFHEQEIRVRQPQVTKFKAETPSKLYRAWQQRFPFYCGAWGVACGVGCGSDGGRFSYRWLPLSPMNRESRSALAPKQYQALGKGLPLGLQVRQTKQV